MGDDDFGECFHDHYITGGVNDVTQLCKKTGKEFYTPPPPPHCTPEGGQHENDLKVGKKKLYELEVVKPFLEACNTSAPKSILISRYL